MASGRVFGVEEDVAGSGAAVAASPGATTIQLDDVADFDEDGGTLRIIGANYADTYAYSDVDDDAATLVISPGLGASLTVGDRVNPEPSAITRYAMVGMEDDDPPILVKVPHALTRHMPTGIRPEGDREAVELREESPGTWVVTDVLGRPTARSGLAETSWETAGGVPIIGGDLETGTDYSIFGTAVAGMDLYGHLDVVPSNPVTLPTNGSGTIRKVGEGGVDTGPVAFTTYVPLKVSAQGIASVANTTGTPYNVRFYLLGIDPGSGTQYAGRHATQTCAANDQTNGRHRQVTNLRQLFVDASEDNPRTINFWWGFQNDSGGPQQANIRNLKMTLRLAYAPDVPTQEYPERAPAWARAADVQTAYLNLEGDDSA